MFIGSVDSLVGWGWTALLGGLILLLLSIFYFGVWRPYQLHSFYRRLHVNGPPHRPLVGNLADIWTLRRQATKMKIQPTEAQDLAACAVPHLSYWSKLYGAMFTYMEGAKVNLCVLDTEIIRELLVQKADCYRRSPSSLLWRSSHGVSQDIIDHKLVHSEPERWTTLRRILGPGSDKDHVQNCLHTIVEISKSLVRRWDLYMTEASNGTGEVEVDAARDIKKISMEIFLINLIGSTISNEQLEEINSAFGEDEKQPATTAELLKAQFASIRFGRVSCLNKLLTETVQARLKAHQTELAADEEPRNRDLLDLMISMSGRRSADREVQKLVCDCQMMIAAQKATTQLISQTLQLLARHPDWQAQARAEVLDLRPLDPPIDEDGVAVVNSVYPKLAKLKVMNQIINESLRLFPPVLSTEKLCEKRHRLGKYTVLPGTFVQVPIVLLHHSSDLWGDDPYSFRPDRFESGAGVRRPFALLPFSAGPSVCLGYNFALQEAKIVMAAILKSFSFSTVPPNLAINPTPNSLIIRNLLVDDIAFAAKQRLTRRHTSFL